MVARTGPTSLTSANSSMKAAAVQTAASATTDQTTSAEGSAPGAPSEISTIGT